MKTKAHSALAHQQFIDWMKATGMVLIVIGHVIGGPDTVFNSVSAPIYSKQLGVAFFVFVAGWGLGSNYRPRTEEAFRRLFPILFWGAVFAVFMSLITWIQKGDLAESNYLPLAFGVNVFLNYFPANPTTWYIGMYLHLIVLWWITGARMPAIWLLGVLPAEILIRAYFLDMDRAFTGYMMVTNWLGVFFLGYYFTRIGDNGDSGLRRVATSCLLTIAWLTLLILWGNSTLSISFDGSFPTRRDASRSLLLTSSLVTLIYLANTAMAFAVFRQLRAPAIIRLIARNSLLIFILHMPLIYALAPKLYPMFEPVWQKKLAMIFIVFAVLIPCSELICRLIPVSQLRDFVWRVLARRIPAP